MGRCPITTSTYCRRRPCPNRSLLRDCETSIFAKVRLKLHLTVAGAETELLAEVGHLDAGAGEVAGLARVVARVVVVHRLGPVILLQLDLFTVN